MPRKRDDDDDDRYDEEDDRPRRRRRDDDDDDDDDDRPRKRRRRDDDDDDLPRIRKRDRSFLDSTYADTSIVILVLFGLCCGWVAVIMSVIALLTCKDPTAKRNATIVLVVAGIIAAMHTIATLMRVAGRAM